jgi:sterol desaturase/sphingolipid hydroxylase (fatty acid hydroxylase superfamily)
MGQRNGVSTAQCRFPSTVAELHQGRLARRSSQHVARPLDADTRPKIKNTWRFLRAKRVVTLNSSGYVHVSMTWDVIKQAFFPAGESSATLTVIYWSILAAFVGLEFFAPQLGKQRRAQRWPANFGLGLINMALVPLAPISGFLAAEWAKRNGIGVLNWLEAWWLFAAIATIAIQSLAAYVTHRLFHSYSPLWRVHRVHHFDTAVDVSTGLRHHPLELALTLLIDSLVAILFGLLPLALMVYGITELMFALFSHANIKLPGTIDHTLRVFFVTPRIHAIHHSAYQPETDSNYGTVLTIWDRLFGTYSDFRANCPELMQFGLSELQDDRANDLWWQLKSPAIDSSSVRISYPVSPK